MALSPPMLSAISVAADPGLHPGPGAELAHADAEGQLEALAAEARDEADRRRRIVQKRVLLRPGPAGGFEHETLHALEVGIVGNRDPYVDRDLGIGEIVVRHHRLR